MIAPGRDSAPTPLTSGSRAAATLVPTLVVVVVAAAANLPKASIVPANVWVCHRLLRAYDPPLSTSKTEGIQNFSSLSLRFCPSLVRALQSA